MSRIIRSPLSKTFLHEDKTIEIQIRDIFTEQFDDINEEQKEPTIEELFSEKNRKLTEERNQLRFERDEFEQYRTQALEEINRLKQLWEEEKLLLQKQAYDVGFQEGYEEGIRKANADMQESLQTANQTIENSIINAQKYIDDQEHVILHLALTSAERIIGAALGREDELFLSIVKRGLKEAREMKDIKLYVSPKYHSLVTKNRDELMEIFPPDVPFIIFVNDELNDTDCYIETNHGRIVVSIDEQLNELRLKLSEILDSKE
nr:flagellar assembly protein FliH [Lysinibacillus timonensis]